MDFDDQLRRYFATDDLMSVTPDVLASGIEHMRVDFGLAQDGERRFALWAMLHMFGAAPDLDVAFDNEEDRNSARNLMELLERAAPE
ncbi:hypothetical protein GCM10009127_06400 [Alteraurantiacibacter aestuarii]|uniref:Uncharacterized protein n=1 Tax=Alteraurantiacibacter aestuarii TaxID=650004 RepID=A0A844ZMX5_9SPHN|nr:hypothetical protein [Alteraurantiacibacter aestuarii]MXO89118.1 hypothetical protein [Alteraurantiacibacter aestuarii]